MELFDYNRNDLMTEGREKISKIEKSGLYEVEVIKAQRVWGSNGSKSEYIKFNVKTKNNEYGNVNVFYKDKTGQEMFSKHFLSKLCFLNKINPSEFTEEREGAFVYIPQFERAKAWVELEAEEKVHKPTGNVYYALNLLNIFDVDTQKTCKELENKETENLTFMNTYQKYAEAEEKEIKENKFPF